VWWKGHISAEATWHHSCLVMRPQLAKSCDIHHLMLWNMIPNGGWIVLQLIQAMLLHVYQRLLRWITIWYDSTLYFEMEMVGLRSNFTAWHFTKYLQVWEWRKQSMQYLISLHKQLLYANRITINAFCSVPWKLETRCSSGSSTILKAMGVSRSGKCNH